MLFCQECCFFQRNKSTISRHIKGVLESGELVADSVVAFFLQQLPQTEKFTMSPTITCNSLKLSGKALLDHAGKISAEVAKAKADCEYTKFSKWGCMLPHN